MPSAPNERLFDRFSVVHAAWGAAFELSGVPAPLALAAQIVFEAVENPLKRMYSPIFPDDAPDAWQNQVGDIASFAAGFYLARLTKGAPAGRAAVVALGAMSGAIWLDRLVQRPATNVPVANERPVYGQASVASAERGGSLRDRPSPRSGR